MGPEEESGIGKAGRETERERREKQERREREKKERKKRERKRSMGEERNKI